MVMTSHEDSRPRAERIAKKIAAAGLCSRREAERWIEAGRVRVNGTLLTSAACVVSAEDVILVDGAALAAPEAARVFLLHKPRGTITTEHDPQGRPTVFSLVPEGLPRLLNVGRLDVETEGLLLLTNDGALKRALEQPQNGLKRTYRVKVHGAVTQLQLDALQQGVTVRLADKQAMHYAPLEARLERSAGRQHWLKMVLEEGKNREIRHICEHLGLKVSRLIRVSYGDFKLGNLSPGELVEAEKTTVKRLQRQLDTVITLGDILPCD